MKNIFKNPIIALYLCFNGLFLLAFSFFFATYAPFLIERGMDLLQINVINAFFMVFVILAEMPTGSFADNFGRHKSISIGCFFLSLSFLTYYFSNSFALFIGAEIIGAVGQTFNSGAMEAWLVDSLKARGEIHLRSWVFRQETIFKSIGAIIGGLLGSIIGEIDLSLPWLASASFMLICAVVSFFLKENYQVEKRIKIRNGLIKQIQEAWQYGINNKELLSMMTFGALISFSIQALNMQWALIFRNDYDFSSWQLGIVFIGISLSTALGSKLSKNIPSFLNEKSAIIIPQLITALAIIICAQANGFVIVTSAFLIHELGRGVLSPLKQVYVNDRLKSESRATLLSLESIFTRLGALGGLLISGLIADLINIKSAWLFSGVFLLLAIVSFLLINKKNVVTSLNG